ncbi:DUF2905 family protein [Siphonobacter aquaeclarae]|uniref:DUF2905 domain-containing protein n=1 Tax=Siphonobacter aquaeclarae TaxID=563176 RepID=A0A1G9VCY1_9BACT|nr:DUF2905 family protein [Siphonobacter aquaeclarae]MBO9640136.1 DUF2905 domain-containing protein [Siphonobacter aquaeclarae]SDM70074.1 Protein of unknown function [Siphonobacter aquaeclarae]
MGKGLMIAGGLLFAAGLLLWIFQDRMPLLGRLPGDIHFRSGKTEVYFPVVTCLVVTVVLNLLIWLIRRWF